jgi:hypothetical protein
VTFLPFFLGNARAQHARERQSSDKSPGPTLLNGDQSKRCANKSRSKNLLNESFVIPLRLVDSRWGLHNGEA